MEKSVKSDGSLQRVFEDVEGGWVPNWPKAPDKEIARLALVLGPKWEAVQSIPWDRCPDVADRERFVQIGQIQVGHFLEMQARLEETHLVLAHAQVPFWAGLSAQLKAVGELDSSLFGAHCRPKWLPFYFREGMDPAGLTGGLGDLVFDGILDAKLLRYKEPHSAIFSMMQGRGDRIREGEIRELELGCHFMARLALRLLPACEEEAKEDFIKSYTGNLMKAVSAQAGRTVNGALWVVAISRENASDLMGSSLKPLPGIDGRYEAKARLFLNKAVTCFPLVLSPHSIAEGVVAVKRQLRSSVGMVGQVMSLGVKGASFTSPQELDRLMLKEAMRRSLEPEKGKETGPVDDEDDDSFDDEELRRALKLSLQEN